MWCHPTCDVMHMQDVINVWRNQINVLFATALMKWGHLLECWGTFMWCHHTCDVIICLMSSYKWCHPTCDVIICLMSSYVWCHAYARCHHTCDVIKLMFYLQQRWWNGGTPQNVGRHSCDAIINVMSSYVWCHPTCDVIVCVISP